MCTRVCTHMLKHACADALCTLIHRQCTCMHTHGQPTGAHSTCWRTCTHTGTCVCGPHVRTSTCAHTRAHMEHILTMSCSCTRNTLAHKGMPARRHAHRTSCTPAAPLYTPWCLYTPWPFLSPDLHQALSLGKDSEREPRDLVKGGGSGSCARPCGEMEGPSPRTQAPARGSRPLRLVQAGARTAPQPIPAQWSQGQLPRGPHGCLTPPSIWKHPPPQLQSPGPGGGVETRTPGPMDSASTGS